jgi:rare lipoprotein A
MKKHFHISFALVLCVFFNGVHAQKKDTLEKSHIKENPLKNILTRYGMASFYAKKFQGRKTSNGEIYRNELLTAACNVFPLNTWIKVTNLINNSWVIVKINDRMHPKNKRLVDLSSSAAQLLGYSSKGLTEVKVEVLHNHDPQASLL